MSISKTEGDYKFKVFSKMSRPPQNIPRKCIIWNLHIPINRGIPLFSYRRKGRRINNGSWYLYKMVRGVGVCSASPPPPEDGNL